MTKEETRAYFAAEDAKTKANKAKKEPRTAGLMTPKGLSTFGSPTSPDNLESADGGIGAWSKELGRRQGVKTQNLFDQIMSMSSSNPLGLVSADMESLFEKFKGTLLGSKQESELDEKARTMLTKGQDIASRLIARINAAQAGQNSPGAAAQTRTKQSLLG